MKKIRGFAPYGDLEGLASQWEAMGSRGAPSASLVAEALGKETEEVSGAAEETEAPLHTGLTSRRSATRRSSDTPNNEQESNSPGSVTSGRKESLSVAKDAFAPRRSTRRVSSRIQKQATTDNMSPHKEKGGSLRRTSASKQKPPSKTGNL